ncbi:chloramphenicol-sensitive protein RarD [Paracoccus halophilus]|uniref:Chloramphenicol-sensitive protein RarD n=1 Tax=Paracoccus halophilus TaxID=376733 RepID=A0A099EZY9_9RHOB|nr:EamA family transporter RarD [Paracoccus halophilus]KGJ03809.1 RarD protein [Paracoccus halophilus]SFA56954.1 chloramphenicol-sensitive protein RarD [Paracoccus halophilus]
MTERSKGFLAIIACCVTWGLSPVYYRLLADVPVIEVLAHRTIWSLLLFLAIFAVQGRLGDLPRAIRGPWAGRIALAALTISGNWGLFIWAVQAGHVVQTSLGYYIYPLVAVLLGVLAYGERLGRFQALAVALAVLAVALLTWGLGVAPWISLTLAASMGFYGVIKKSLPLGPAMSVGGEVALLTPLALLWLALQGGGALPAGLSAPLAFGSGWGVSLLLAFSGVITAIPLVLFAYSARRVEMTTLGLMFYLNPTLQFLCAVALFGERVTGWHVIAFAMIWTALAIYSVAGIRQSRRAVALANG